MLLADPFLTQRFLSIDSSANNRVIEAEIHRVNFDL